MSVFHRATGARGDDRFYRWKVLIFVTGGALGVAGMTSGRDFLVAIGIGVLAIGVVLRLIEARRRRLEEAAQEREQAAGNPTWEENGYDDES